MYKYLALLVAAVFSLPNIASASSMSVIVNTNNETINAIEGTVSLPGRYNVQDIQTGGSAVIIWINKPTFNEEARTITFSGLTPGGFSGERMLFDIVLSDLAGSDVEKISFKNVSGLKNDGEGTKTKVSLSVKKALLVSDEVPPESFIPLIAESEEIFDGRKFISFDTQDKGDGVESYLLSEKMFFSPRESDWMEASSPYAIEDTWLIKKVYIKAVDGEGNSRVEVVPLPNRKYFVIIFAIIIGTLCVINTRHFSKWRLLSRSS